MSRYQDIRARRFEQMEAQGALNAEFEHVANRLMDAELTRQTLRDTRPNFEFVPGVHNSPAYQAMLRDELQRQLARHKHAEAPPIQRASPALPAAMRRGFQAKVYVFTGDDRDTPGGRFTVGLDGYRLNFRSFDVALENQKHACVREWAHWAYGQIGLHYRRDTVALPDDLNARASFSALHHEDDPYGQRGAAVGNVLVWAIWEGAVLTDLAVVHDRSRLLALDVRANCTGWAGYKASVSKPA